MKDVLKDKIVFILLILTSIDFIYSRCCCGGNNGGSGGKGGSKTNIISSQGDPGKQEEIPAGKQGYVNYIKNTVADYFNKVKNVGWVCTYTDRFTVKYECIEVAIKRNDAEGVSEYIDRVYNVLCIGQRNLDIDANVAFKCVDGWLKVSISKNYTLEELRNSIKTDLEDIKSDIYLPVYDDVGKNEYINLRNGVIYKVECDSTWEGYVGRENLKGVIGFSTRYPCYKDGVFYIYENGFFTNFFTNYRKAEGDEINVAMDEFYSPCESIADISDRQFHLGHIT